MNVTANNITEVVISLIALAGEVPKDLKIQEVKEKTFQNQISKAKKDSILKIDNNHKRIRLKAPKGLELLNNFSEELFLHYNMVTNNHQFQTSKKAIQSQKYFSQAVLQMVRNGFEIDNFNIVHKSNHFGKNEEERDEIDFVLGSGLLDIGMNKFAADGKIIPLVESASLLTQNERRFYTSKYLKLGSNINDRINVSRISGIMLTEGNMYNVYRLDDGSKIFKSAEYDMNNIIRKIYMSAYGKTLNDFEAIIITNLLPARTERLDGLFSHYYFIPNNIYGDVVIQILSRKNWKAKLQEALYGEVSPNPRVDGIMNDIPSIEILSCEYSKIQKIKKIAGNNPVDFIAFEWQKPIVDKLARGMNYTCQVLTAEQELVLLNYMKE